MDSKMKELSAEEMDLVTGGLTQPNPFTFDSNGKVIPADQFKPFTDQSNPQ